MINNINLLQPNVVQLTKKIADSCTCISIRNGIRIKAIIIKTNNLQIQSM